MNLSKKLFISLLVLTFLVGGAVSIAAVQWFGDDTTTQPVEENESENEEEDTTPDDQKEEEEKTSGDEEGSEEYDLSTVEETLQLIEKNYVKDVDKEELLEGAVEGMVNKLEDPYSEYMDPETTEQFNSQLESSFEGIGAEVTKREGYITIIAPLKDAPAEEVGLRPNDRVIEVDGESLEGYTVYEAVSLIRGEKGTDVTLTIDRPGDDEPFEVTITRDTIPLKTVYSEVEEQNGQNVGVLQIRSFGEGTAEEFKEKLTKLEEEENIEGLIIDVRGNPGGLFSAVEAILGNFMNDDEPYVQTAREGADPEGYYVNGSEKDYPISVLVNEGSASASEILAAALKEVGGYDIVGQTTFGKGTVQQTLPLGDGMLKVTVLNWLSPEGNQINEVGVEPTIEVEQPEFFYLSLIQAEEELALDSNGKEVEKLQVMLEGLGYEPGRTDGYFDEGTEQAVEEFQEANGLDTTGVLDEDTENKLEEMILEEVNDSSNDKQLQEAMQNLFE
ncbi:peptidase S41 [Halalkalibacillus sediminis]|uniref:C-terminal processing peptidase n=1 Tax=Halalkalibacillus sediminis TaxID=2018042 RepID=A0A2I0QUH5_9BACI|nr:S41 family peptidase [Halalkalibacillus sediminis]PKR78002.1 peptidase S41 [Halalkalibacillus sediminis]